MRYLIFLLIIICSFASCTNKVLPIEYSNMELTINTAEDAVSDSLSITVCFENNSTNDIYLLNERYISISRNKASMWNLEILFQDTVLMITPVLISYGYPTKKDYFLLKSGDNYTFTFNVDFRTLIREDLYNFREFNDDFGEYSLRLTYKDSFLIEKRAFRGEIESNKIKVVYRK